MDVTPGEDWRENLVVNADSRNALPNLPDESVQLTVTSPPYNIDKDYGEYDDRQRIEVWEKLMRSVMEELFRVTKPDGKVCINVGFSTSDTDRDGRLYRIPLNNYIINIANEVGFDLLDEIVWIKPSFSSHGGGALYGSYPDPPNLYINQMHEYILVFNKWVSEDYIKTREKPSKGSERRNESEVTKEEWNEYTRSVWEIPPASPKQLGVDHKAIFPEEIPHRLTKLYSWVGDTVLDPFFGTGTTGVAAADNDRSFIGIEQNEEFVEVAGQRLNRSLKRTVRSRKRAKSVEENAQQRGQMQTGLGRFDH